MTSPSDFRFDFWNCPLDSRLPYSPFFESFFSFPTHVREWRNGKFKFGIYPENALWLVVPILTALLWAFLRLKLKAFFTAFAMKRVANKKVGQKFAYQMWLLFYYTSYTTAGWLVLRSMPWWGAPLNCNSNVEMWYPQYLMQAQPMSLVFGVYYLTQCGFYIEELWATVAEPHRKDYYEYLLHHSVSISLIALSWLAAEQRIGSLVFLYHDIPDIFLCAAKICNYLSYQRATDTFFIMFMFVFGFFRLFMFPALIVTAWSLAQSNYETSAMNWILPCLLLFGLVPLHCYWMYLIIKMAWRAILVKKVESDVRSDSECDDTRRTNNKVKKLRKAKRTKQVPHAQ
eukprot:TRINITY_DN58598_c0_g1_i1.p1 TRINITY_DN58598_c0_g1~~TRINITY_DN58598_c0_g1_i1.p1  ORF type:complete len:343 (-),score=13.41 TRINITY_DN58598_c0_g1_i1:166-1194(-)